MLPEGICRPTHKVKHPKTDEEFLARLVYKVERNDGSVFVDPFDLRFTFDVERCFYEARVQGRWERVTNVCLFYKGT